MLHVTLLAYLVECPESTSSLYWYHVLSAEEERAHRMKEGPHNYLQGSCWVCMAQISHDFVIYILYFPPVPKGSQDSQTQFYMES